MSYLGVVGTNFSNVAATSLVITVSGAVAAGGTVLGGVVWESSDNSIPTISSIVDSRGNTYVVDQSVGGNSTFACILVRGRITNALQSGDTITVTIAAARSRWAASFQGFNDLLLAFNSSSLDVSASNVTASGVTMDSGTTARTSKDQILAFVVHGVGVGKTFTPPAGWTAAASVETTAASTNRAVKTLHRYTTVVGTQNAVTTISPAGTSVGLIGAYKVASARNNYTRTEHRAESLGNGTTLTPANSGGAAGIAYNAVTGSLTADSTNVGKGSRGMKATVTAATTASGSDTTTIGTTRIVRGRALVKITGAPPATLRIAQADQSGSLGCAVTITTTRQLRLEDSTGTQMAISGSPLPLNQYVRIEWRFVASTTVGTASASYWTSPDSTGAATETITSAASFNTKSTFDRYQSGALFAANQTYTAYIDEVVWTTDDGANVGAYVDPVVRTFDFEGATPLVNRESSANASVISGAARLGSMGLRLDSRTLPAYFKHSTLTFGTGRRWASLAAWMRQPSGSLDASAALVTIRNTDPAGDSNGGIGMIWIDSTTGFIKANLSPDPPMSGAVNLASNWFYLQAVCAFKADGSSSLKVKVDGVELGTVTGVPFIGETLMNVVLGSEAVASSMIDVDSYELSVSDSTLDYIGSAGTPAGTYVRSGGVWKIATSYVLSGGVWVQARPHVRSGGSWVELV